jgi:hypothetical protein
MFDNKLVFAMTAIMLGAAPQAATAQQRHQSGEPVYHGHWMHSDVTRAWSKGFYGQGAKVTVIDSFHGGIRGNLKGKWEWKSHGGWTSEQVRLLAPSAKVIEQNHEPRRLKLPSGFNVLNLSFGAPEKVDARRAYGALNNQGQSIVDHARNGSAVVVKAAGNQSSPERGKVPVGKWEGDWNDAMALALKGTKSAIFVGALEKHGSKKAGKKARMAGYSNIAGKDQQFNSRFVVVGVPAGKTGLGGTSFAAPQIAGYAAILHSKFQKASPTQISNQILNTARRDTIVGYDLHIHGRGEADLSRALAPKRVR